jgi:hypothetical protein
MANGGKIWAHWLSVSLSLSLSLSHARYAATPFGRLLWCTEMDATASYSSKMVSEGGGTIGARQGPSLPALVEHVEMQLKWSLYSRRSRSCHCHCRRSAWEHDRFPCFPASLAILSPIGSRTTLEPRKSCWSNPGQFYQALVVDLDQSH